MTRDEVVEAIYRNHGCSCEAHYSQGEAASCERWRRKQAELIASIIGRRVCVVVGCTLPEAPGNFYCTLHEVKWGRGDDSQEVNQ